MTGTSADLGSLDRKLLDAMGLLEWWDRNKHRKMPTKSEWHGSLSDWMSAWASFRGQSGQVGLQTASTLKLLTAPPQWIWATDTDASKTIKLGFYVGVLRIVLVRANPNFTKVDGASAFDAFVLVGEAAGASLSSEDALQAAGSAFKALKLVFAAKGYWGDIQTVYTALKSLTPPSRLTFHSFSGQASPKGSSALQFLGDGYAISGGPGGWDEGVAGFFFGDSKVYGTAPTSDFHFGFSVAGVNWKFVKHLDFDEYRLLGQHQLNPNPQLSEIEVVSEEKVLVHQKNAQGQHVGTDIYTPSGKMTMKPF